ncbi:glycosyltransferase family 61 protein [Brytella acorum]|uniref:Glycosyltransferase family 61 protein n=2 Tax=Brytella acorum TaxID=2959299 RepID=A0AA35UZ81_9PROT|nr:glycosyltransferase family 61 protein [Brytella acorum]CAI9122192.1 glycosyltransferase family 61 protein [Brytella acorum]
MKKHEILSLPMRDISETGLPFVELAKSSMAINMTFHSILGVTDGDALMSLHRNPIYEAVGYYVASNAMVTYDGTIIYNDNIVSSPTLNVSELNRHVLEHFLEGELPLLHPIGGLSVVLYGFGWVVYGHWLVEFFTRVYTVHAFGMDLNKITWILPNDVPQYVLSFLSKIGIRKESLFLFDHKREIVCCENLLIPVNLCKSSSNAHPLFEKYCQWFRKLCVGHEAALDKCNKLFVTRKSFTNHRPVVNGDELKEISQEFGYQVFSPETMSLDEQIEIFSTAASIAGEYGSGLHNSIFAPEHAVITALRINRQAFGFVQSSLAAAGGQTMS